jgi:hypothetical protein
MSLRHIDWNGSGYQRDEGGSPILSEDHAHPRGAVLTKPKIFKPAVVILGCVIETRSLTRMRSGTVVLDNEHPSFVQVMKRCVAGRIRAFRDQLTPHQRFSGPVLPAKLD